MTFSKYFLPVIFIFCFLPDSKTQTDDPKLDSLKLALQNAVEDSTKMNTLDLISGRLRFSDPQKAKSYCFQYLNLAKTNNDTLNVATAFIRLSSIYYRGGINDSSKIMAQKTIDYLNDPKSEKLITTEGKAFAQLGIASYAMGNNKKALSHYTEAIKRIKDEQYLNVIYNNIGNVLLDSGDAKGALENYSKMKDYGKKIGDKRYESVATKNIGNVYQSIKEYEKAIEYWQKAMDLRIEYGDENGTLSILLSLGDIHKNTDIEKSKEIYRTLLHKSKKLNNEHFIVMAYIALTELHLDIGNITKAETYNQASFEITNKDINDKQKKYKVLSNRAAIFNKKKEYSKAVRFSKEAVEGFRQSDIIEKENYLKALSIHAEALQFSGNSKEAWSTLRIRDSLIQKRNKVNQKAEIADAEVKFRLREKELEFKKTKAENELRVAAAKNKQNIFLSLFGAASALLVLGFFSYRRNQRVKKEIEKQKQLIEKSLLEKEVMLKEIHHRVKNNLQIIIGLLDKQGRKSNDLEVKKLLEEGKVRVHSMALVHQNLYQSENLSSIDIKSYILELAKNIGSTQTQKDIKLDINVDESKLDIDRAIPLGLILNELITNSFKYAFEGKKSGVISIDFHKIMENTYRLLVKDNGIGMPKDLNISTIRTLGLNLVGGLVRQLDGQMEHSSTAQGTSFDIKF